MIISYLKNISFFLNYHTIYGAKAPGIVSAPYPLAKVNGKKYWASRILIDKIHVKYFF